MLRRFLLAPVICLILVGFMGTSFSPLQARTTEKSVKPTDIARQHREKQQVIQDNPDTPAPQEGINKASQHKNTSIKHPVKKKTSARSKKAVTNKKRGSKKRVANHSIPPSQRPGNRKSGGPSGNTHLSALTLPGQQPSDLWLARDNPEAYKVLKKEELTGDLDKLTMNILYSAYRCLGTPYRYGGTTPSGFDCSGFVQHVFGENGISLGRSSRDQAREGIPIELSELKPGDLIFFNMRPKKHSSIDHVGLYIGNGQFIHASSYRSREITIEELESGSYLNRLVGARRVLEYTSNEAVVIE